MAAMNGTRRRSCLRLEPLERRLVLAAAAGDLPDGGDLLTVAAVAPQYAVKQAPRLQPGNAPLMGYPGGDLDRVDLLWQTIPAGAGTSDSFVVDWRPVGGGEWQAAGLNTAIDTGVEGRLVHSATITGLAWDADYEYRVRHLRAADIVTTYQHAFHTRLAAGDDASFSFVAYGDSASGSAAGFRTVQARINQVDPAFAVLLGDNVYAVGSHAEADARFDPLVNPEAAAWMASHVDWLGLGNHDVATASGLPSEQSYSVPIPVAGVTAPAAPPAGERPEHSFSWDYGSVHFVTFDTNALHSATRLDGLLDWVVADLSASTARWKIVYGHHPLAGVPDKPESPAGTYYQQVVNRLKAAGVDLFMTGHSHTYSWTYPLTGQVDGVATYEDHGADDHFHAGVGLTQLVSGVGGVGVRDGDYGQFPFVAEGFSGSTPVAARLGFSQIDVTADALTVKYVAADDGAVIDSFRIEKEAVQTASFQQGVGSYVGTTDTMLREDSPATSHAATTSLKVDADNPTGSGQRTQALLRFDALFGDGPGQIPANAVLRSATLTLHRLVADDDVELPRPGHSGRRDRGGGVRRHLHRSVGPRHVRLQRAGEPASLAGGARGEPWLGSAPDRHRWRRFRFRRVRGPSAADGHLRRVGRESCRAGEVLRGRCRHAIVVPVWRRRRIARRAGVCPRQRSSAGCGREPGRQPALGAQRRRHGVRLRRGPAAAGLLAGRWPRDADGHRRGRHVGLRVRPGHADDSRV